MDLARPASTAARNGSASRTDRFVDAVYTVASDTGLSPEQVALDYWLVRVLHTLHRRLPRDGTLTEAMLQRRRSVAGPPIIGTWVFSGGNSLSLAWGITRRFSDDIDGSLLSGDRIARFNHRARACRVVAEWSAAHPAFACGTTWGGKIRTTMLSAAGCTARVKLETAMLPVAAELATPCVVNSLLARRGDPGWSAEFPELGGFSLPCIRPSWTAACKLDALRRRAAAGDLVGLRARGRDVYDLWAISIRAPHADETRQAIPEMWRDASGAVRPPTPRPRRGYAESPAFSAGTPAYGALRDGYLQAVSATVWGDRPRFETAVAAARSLDPS